MKIAILDDNEDNILELKEKIHNIIDVDIICFKYELEFMEWLYKGGHVDLLFLDIVLTEKNGIEIAKILNEKFKNIYVVYISSYIGYVTDIFDTDYIYFLEKPISEEKLKKAFDKYNKILESNYIHITNNKMVFRIPLKSIVCVESEKRNIIINYISGEQQSFNAKITDIVQLLPDMNFIRTHQSFIANLQYMRHLRRNCLIMEGGIEVPISRAYTSEVKNKITFFLGDIE